MTVENFLKQFSDDFDIAISLSAEGSKNFESTFEGGKTVVSYIQLSRDLLVLQSEVCELPSNDEEVTDLLEKALKGNLALLRKNRSVLSLDSSESSLLLSRKLRLDSLSSHRFNEIMEDFLHQVDVFRNGLNAH